jgi:hypothetical protein
MIENCANKAIQSPLLSAGVRNFVYLAYMDDSDTKAKAKKWQVLTAVMIKDQSFNVVELLSSLVIADLMPEEKRDMFEEFHACELFGGYP